MLPYEIQAMIFTMDAETWIASVQKLGILTVHPYIQTAAKSKFLEVKCLSYCIEFRCFGVLHRPESGKFGGPAVIYNHGAMNWWRHGKLHRSQGPAWIQPNTTFTQITWFQNGKRHRTSSGDTGPADMIVGQDIMEFTWQHHGRIHRIDQPAIIRVNTKTSCVENLEWCIHGEIHRIEGPARIRQDLLEWHQNNQKHGMLIKDDFEYGLTQTWYVLDKIHRIQFELPAVISSDILVWKINDVIHRTQLPAVISINQLKIKKKYYQYGKRLDSES